MTTRNAPTDSSITLAGPPGSWRPFRVLAQRALAPIERFLAIQAASGILLLVAAGIALAWANSPWRESYHALWQVPLGVRLGAWSFERDLHFWVNDVVMTLFFFVVGLEIRREIHRGELSELRRAALPLIAALGGMVAPACIFIAINRGHPSVHGWGIPTATDIAFAVGVLTLLGSRVPPALRILLLALAVIDDVGAIIVIAFFYSSRIAMGGFALVAAGVGGIYALQALGVRKPWAYALPSCVIWVGAYRAGIHPTLAGVAVGMLTPARAWFGPRRFAEKASAIVADMRANEGEADAAVLARLDDLNHARLEAVSPVDRLQHALHGWVAFGAMPLFALANAGVSLGQATFASETLLVFLGVSLGLVVGKPIGIFTFSWLAQKAGIAALPRGMTWTQLALMGMVAGIGFTMSIFIAGLAFQPGPHLETAKIGILLGSGVAAVVGFGVGRLVLPASQPAGAAKTASEAERSTAR